MELEILSNLEGDKKKQLPTTTEECRLEVKRFFDRQIKSGAALFLERGNDTFRILGYDPKKDELKVRVDRRKGKVVGAKSEKGRKTSVPPRAGG